jgi:hypothetical protein
MGIKANRTIIEQGRGLIHQGFLQAVGPFLQALGPEDPPENLPFSEDHINNCLVPAMSGWEVST